MRELFNKRVRFLMLIVGALAGGLVVASLVVDEGELVVVTTVDENGREFETHVWIVEIDSVPYLRAATPGAAWLARMRAHPTIEMTREGMVARYEASFDVDDAQRARVDESMAAKYGTADRLWSRLTPREHSTPIRLRQVSEATVATSEHHGGH